MIRIQLVHFWCSVPWLLLVGIGSFSVGTRFTTKEPLVIGVDIVCERLSQTRIFTVDP